VRASARRGKSFGERNLTRMVGPRIWALVRGLLAGWAGLEGASQARPPYLFVGDEINWGGLASAAERREIGLRR